MSATTTVPPVRLGAGERLRTLVRGRPEDPAWVRPGIAGALLLAAVLCLWELTSSGYSNTYYAAAAKAGSESWKAWFFGSLDPGNFITARRRGYRRRGDQRDLVRGLGLNNGAG